MARQSSRFRLPQGSSLPGSGVAGEAFFLTTNNVTYVHNGTSWVPVDGVKTFERTWTILGVLAAGTYPGPFLPVGSGRTLKLTKARYVLQSGTSIAAKLTITGVGDITGFTGISCTTTAATTDPTDVSITDLQQINLVLSSPSASPNTLSLSAIFEESYT